jgi:hypothetical protein
MPPKKPAAAPAVGMRSISSFFSAAPKKSLEDSDAASGDGRTKLTSPADCRATPRTEKKSSEAKTSKRASIDYSPASPAADDVSPAKGSRLEEKLGGANASSGANPESTAPAAAFDGKSDEKLMAVDDADEQTVAATVDRSGRPSRCAANQEKRDVLESSDGEDNDAAEKLEKKEEACSDGANSEGGELRKRIHDDISDESDFKAGT